MDYAELVQLKELFGYNTAGFCKILGVTKPTFYKWKQAGVPKPTEQLVRILKFRPDVVIEVLMLNADEILVKYSLTDLMTLDESDERHPALDRSFLQYHREPSCDDAPHGGS